jgi:hypothetical protein
MRSMDDAANMTRSATRPQRLVRCNTSKTTRLIYLQAIIAATYSIAHRRSGPVRNATFMFNEEPGSAACRIHPARRSKRDLWARGQTAGTTATTVFMRQAERYFDLNMDTSKEQPR